jgi:hypothetical protein
MALAASKRDLVEAGDLCVGELFRSRIGGKRNDAGDIGRGRASPRLWLFEGEGMLDARPFR